MNTKGIGILLGAIGAGLIWHFRNKFHGLGTAVKRVPIVLKVRADGRCGIEHVRDVELCRGEPMQWDITNPDDGCAGPVEVRIESWRKGGGSSDAPVKTVGPASRSVKPGQTKPLPARAKPFVDEGDYSYEIWLDGELALDPIVKIVL